jgi:hypothetical protein
LMYVGKKGEKFQQIHNFGLKSLHHPTQKSLMAFTIRYYGPTLMQKDS